MDIKVCPRCSTAKPLTEFSFRDTARTKPQFQCKDCTRSYKRRWYADNSIRHRQVSDAAKRRRIAKNAGQIREYLQSHRCVDCGEADPLVLEFDHVRGEKRGDISRMMRERPWAIVLAEIEKCDVRCANCHRRRTAKQSGWYTYLTGPEMGPSSE